MGTSRTGVVLVAEVSAGAEGTTAVTGSTILVRDRGETEYSSESRVKRGASLEIMQRGTGRTHPKQHTSFLCSLLLSKNLCQSPSIIFIEHLAAPAKYATAQHRRRHHHIILWTCLVITKEMFSVFLVKLGSGQLQDSKRDTNV